MTAPSVLREQNRDALARSSVVADALAERYPEVVKKAEQLKNASGRDRLHTETARLIALAEFMEAVAEAVGLEVDDEADERTLEDIDGIGPEVADNLRAAGLQTPADLREASDEGLLATDGIGPGKLRAIRADL